MLSISYSGIANSQLPILTIYTYESFASEFGPGPVIKTEFEKTCECEVKFVGVADGVTLLNKIRQEGKDSTADIILGLDNNLLQEAVDTGLFAPSNVNLQDLDLPFGWATNLFIPYDYGFFSFVYDKNKTKEIPVSLKELVYSDKPWTIIYQDPRTSTPGLGLVLWMQTVFGDDSPDAWANLAKKTVTVTKGWSESYALFLKGEADFVLSYTTSPAYHITEENKDNYAAVDMEEGHYLQIEIAGKLASTPHPELADKFMQFMISPKFQSVIPTTNWMYPVTSDATKPASFAQLALPKHALEYGAVEVADGKQNWVNIWQKAVSQ
ncbi:thiamine ABC transporter substrate binding subunit [Thorsellia anophelis]|uniref:thiamine ABC transporter substrate binding subunit n=1 Tax=Thorsellia anophelis TaxID=336804 RepID=UPI001FE1CDCD|nr:thiamine ABC transporter substrate binding subunit [Thorsellia anophelis]